MSDTRDMRDMRHNSYNYECTEPRCKRKFRSPTQLARHIANVHHNGSGRNKTVSVGFQPRFLVNIDAFWDTHGFSSRSAFIEHALRAYMEYINKMEKERA